MLFFDIHDIILIWNMNIGIVVKKLLCIITFLFCCISNLYAETKMDLEEEFIKPLRYPKFSIMGDYNLVRHFHGFADKALRHSLENYFGATLAFESGLYKYLNAGALFSFTIPQSLKDSAHMRFALFAKPYIPITNNFSIFTRFGGGLTSSAGSSILLKLNDYKSPAFTSALMRIYEGQQYSSFAPGALAMASIGFEYFPFSRLGLLFEAGIRAEIFYASKGDMLLESALGKNDASKGLKALAYMTYEVPLALTLNIIL